MSPIVFSPVYTWVTVGLLTASALGALFWSLRHGVQNRRRALGLAGFRLASIILLAVILLQPQQRRDEVTVIKPQIAILVDATQSMEDPADPGQPLRSERVKEWLASPALAAAKKSFEFRTFYFDSRLTERTTEAEPLSYGGNSTHIWAAFRQLRERFLGQPLAAVLLLSDGLDSSGVTSALSLPPNVPVLAFELEKEFRLAAKPKRTWIASIDAPGRLVVGWDGELRASLGASGLSGSTVGVELWKDGAKTSETTVTFNEEEQIRPVVFPITATDPGIMQFEVRLVDPNADPDSRKRSVTVEAVAPGKRVLYVQNSFGFEFKFLRRAIVGDRNLQLQAYVRAGDGRLVAMGERGGLAGGSPAPRLDLTQAGLGKYAVVVLGDLPAEALVAENYQALKSFVERGGGLVLLGGASGMATEPMAKSSLGEISPVRLPAEYREGRYPVRITEVGMRHPVLGTLFSNVKEFPPLLTANLSNGLSPAAEVLLEFEEGGRRYPAVAASRFGQGRVVTVMTDTVWHWRMGSKGWNSEKSPYDTFWTQLMEWLVPREQEKQGIAKLELLTEKPNYLIGEQPAVRAILQTGADGAKAPATLPLSLRTPDGKVFEYTMKPGEWTDSGGKTVSGFVVPVEPHMAGMFTAQSRWSNGKLKLEGETRFVVDQPMSERTGKPIDRILLQNLAEQSGGRLVRWEEREDWQKWVHYKEQQIAKVRLEEIWNHPVLLVLLLLALAGDWILRKRWSLP